MPTGRVPFRQTALELAKRGVELATERRSDNLSGECDYRRASQFLVYVHCQRGEFEAAREAYASACKPFESCALDCPALQKHLESE